MEEAVNQRVDTFPYQTLRVYLGDSFIDGSVILKNDLEKYCMKVWRIFVNAIMTFRLCEAQIFLLPI